MVRVLGISSNADGSHLEDDLGGFEGKGKYSDPEFSWRQSVAPTAIAFLSSDKLGKQYENDIFVGTVNGGNIFKFDLNNNRTELVLGNLLDDKVADTADELEDVTFADGLGLVTDIEVGPDGYLYVVSLGHEAIYRIVPADNGNGTPGDQ